MCGVWVGVFGCGCGWGAAEVVAVVWFVFGFEGGLMVPTLDEFLADYVVLDFGELSEG